MRKVKWAAAAAGVLLLVAGCGNEGGSDKAKDKGGQAPAAGSPAPAAGAGTSGGAVDAAAVKKQIEAAATSAGFTEQPGDDVPANLKSCMVSWTADGKKVSDSRKSYDATVATLVKDGWKETRTIDQPAAVVKSLDKTGWTLKASHQGKAGALLVVSFIATETSATCAKAFQEDLAKNKQ
ncbi:MULTISPECIES: hypothetical protein [unclassified Streptomyces]|uniref:hypothetical protein n=1 Tax=unclassified Streptomyces TaxID=2593676 RepID=UPI002E122042|nr:MULTISPECIES: hypothetical protein [unclassified Streptomyces]WSR23071.1 hypothetical protein OG573_30695 [Streptomyces sp. NBC_01205]